MNLFLLTVIVHLKLLAKEAVFPLLLTAVTVIIFIIVGTVKKNISGKKVFIFKLLSLASVVFVVSLILRLTLFNRIGGKKVDSTAKLWENWSVDTLEFSLDLSSVENIIMFIFFALAINFFLHGFCKKVLSPKRIIAVSTLLSLGFSLFIELTQAVFSIGLLQFSDMFYNTLGGTAGALIYLLLRKIITATVNKRKSLHKEN